MRAVVTGAAGFIGSHLVDELVGRGYRVTGIDRQSRQTMTPGYGHVALDIAEDPSDTGLAGILSDTDIVFHLAGKPGVRGSGPHVEGLRWRDNVVSAHNVLSLTPKATPVVAASSSSVYGGSDSGPGGPVASCEDHPVRPRGGYARSKVAMEWLCQERRARGGLAAVIRPFTVAGESQRPDMAFSIWLEAARMGLPIRVFGAETRSRDITDVRHLIEGLVRAGERRVNETINLGTGVCHRIIDLARGLLAVSGLDGRIVRESAPSDEVGVTLADTRRCRELLGFVPETDLPALLRRQIHATAALPAKAGT